MELTEQWKPIIGYEGLYEVSNFGKIKSLPRKFCPREKILRFGSTPSGYLHCVLSRDGKLRTANISIYVWDHFGDQPRNGHKIQVDHIDGDKSNNRIDNLQLLTGRQNVTKYWKDNRSNGLPVGVVFLSNKYAAYIVVGQIKIYLGRYKTITEASLAYNNRLSQLNQSG